MAPKRTVRAVMGSVVRTRRTLVQETVEVSVVQKTTPKEKKVVEVEVRDMEAEQPPAPPQTAVGEEKDESEEETQPPLESEEGQQVEEERRGGKEPRADGGGGGFKGEIEPELAAEEEEDKKARAAEGGKIEEVKKGDQVEKQRRRRRRRTKAAGGGGSAGGRSRGYKRYVYRVLKQVHPELRVSSMAMTVLDSLMKDMFERLAEEAARLSKYSGKATLSSREVQGAVRLVLPGELGKHAVAEGSKAVANYMAAETSRRR